MGCRDCNGSVATMGKAVTECYSWYNNSVVGKYIPDDKGVCSESFNELRVSVHCNTMDNNVSNGIGVALEATIDGVNWVNLRKECISDSFYMDRFFWKALRFVTYATDTTNYTKVDVGLMLRQWV